MILSLLSAHLWDFSLKLYRQPGVEPLCLMLQDRWRADVNILFWLRWLETESMAINATRIRLAEAHVAAWKRDVILPLRQLRTEIKRDYSMTDKAVEATREAVKSAELQAERVVQVRLEKLSRTWLAGAERQQVIPGSNLAIYGDYLGLPPALTRELQQTLCIDPA